MGTARPWIAITALVLACTSVHAQSAASTKTAPPKVTVNIEAQPIRGALQAFGKQTGVQVLFRSEDASIGNVTTPRVSGELSAQEALDRLLANTGLKYEFVNKHTVRISSARPLSTIGDGGGDNASAFRVAQGDNPKSSDTGPAQNSSENEKKQKVDLQEIVVTGSRIPLTAGQQSRTTQTYSREVIHESGQTTVADFLNTLPDASLPSHEGVSQRPFGETTVQLHGLPVGTTLVLLNGRRLQAGVQSDGNGFFNLNNIPAVAVERIDVLPVGSSAIYGGDSLAGAVNIILRNNLHGAEVNAGWGHAAGADEGNFDFGWGRGDERGSVSFIANFQYRNELLGAGRPLGTRIDFPAADSAAPLWDGCNPGTIYSLDGTPLPGLGSATEAAIPAGLTGKPSLQAFLATAGKINRCNLIGPQVLIPPTRRVGALLSAHYQLSDRVEVFTETLYSHEHQNEQLFNYLTLTGGSFGFPTLGANNPYNPFGEMVGVSFTSPALGAEGYDYTQWYVRPLIGVRGKMFSDWNYEVTASFEENRSYAYSRAIQDLTAIQAALDSADPVTALNPFNTGTPGTPQLLKSLAADAALQSTQSLIVNQMRSAQAFFRGPTLKLPAGKLQAVLGGEYADQHQDLTLPPPRLLFRRKSYAVFTEAKIPLFARLRESEEGGQLSLNIAARYDHSDDFGGKVTWQSGLTWRPTDSLLFRADYGTSYQAPQLIQIQGPASNFPETVIDTLRGNETVLVPVSFGSNPNLRPETGHAQSLGVVYTSLVAPGLTASLTYFDMAIRNYIGFPDTSVLISNPSLFPGAVIRAPATPKDQQQGFPGPITALSQLYYNFGDLNVAGVDFDVGYRGNTAYGEWTPSIAISNIYKWQSALIPGAATIDYVSQATKFGVGFAPRWKGVVALGWKRGAYSAHMTGRYVGRYKDYQDFVPNTNVLGNFWIYDANLHVDLGTVLARGTGWVSATSLELGAVNLFDKSIPFSYNANGYDPALYDVRGRFLYGRVSVKF